MTIVTFINFNYNNQRYDSSVTLNFNKDSIIFNTRANAISWLKKHGFKVMFNPDTDVWQRMTDEALGDERNYFPYTAERAIITTASSDYDEQGWIYFCHEGHCE